MFEDGPQEDGPGVTGHLRLLGRGPGRHPRVPSFPSKAVLIVISFLNP